MQQIAGQPASWSQSCRAGAAHVACNSAQACSAQAAHKTPEHWHARLAGAFNTTTGPAHWELLQKARAVDNQLFVATCSPARNPEASYQAWGHSTAVNPFGKASPAYLTAQSLVLFYDRRYSCWGDCLEPIRCAPATHQINLCGALKGLCSQSCHACIGPALLWQGVPGTWRGA